jgi:hypothetical protein
MRRAVRTEPNYFHYLPHSKRSDLTLVKTIYGSSKRSLEEIRFVARLLLGAKVRVVRYF